jgi:uncharacterized Zn finger protein (UPF0148 family)
MSNPVRTATTDLRGRPKYLEPAPYLLRQKCSDCGVAMALAGNGDLGVCPKCYALLWHKDFGEEVRRLRREREETERLRQEQLRKSKAEMKERAKQGSHQVVPQKGVLHQVKPYRPSTAKSHRAATLKSKRRRLVELLWARARSLYAQYH